MKALTLKGKPHLALTVLMLLVSFCAPANTIKETQNSIKKVETQTRATKATIARTKRKQAKMQASIKKIDTKIATERLRLQKLLSDISATEQEIKTQESKILLLQEQHQKAIEALKRDLQRTYRASREPWLKSILSGDDYSNTQRIPKWIGIVQLSQKNHADDFATSAKALEQAQIVLEATRSSLLAQQQNSQAQHTKLTTLRLKQLNKSKTFKKLLAQSKSQLKTLNVDRQSLTRLLSKLQQKQRRQAKNRLRQPTNADWPVSGSLQHKYGDAREGGKLKWQGWYIGAPRGKPVKAVADGKVIFSNWLRGFGMLVIIDHDSDYHTLYAHADALSVAEGTQVKKGEIIAYTGSSGGAEVAGIYFEVRHRGKAINPKKWLKRA